MKKAALNFLNGLIIIGLLIIWFNVFDLKYTILTVLNLLTFTFIMKRLLVISKSIKTSHENITDNQGKIITYVKRIDG